MSVPESSSSKGRPSLLSETAPGPVDNNSRILASLEGRVVAQQPPRRRSKKPAIAAGAAVVAFAALGAWQWLRGQQNDASVATAAPAATVAAKAVPASGAVPGVGAASSVQVAQAADASAQQAAVIVADDTARGSDDAGSAGMGASSPRGADADRLSRALANGAAPGQNGDTRASAAVAVAASSAPAAKAQAPVKTMAARTQRESAKQNPRESAKARHAEKLAVAHARKHGKARPSAVKDDPDVDLLAALVARTKPYDAKPAKAASAASATGGVSKAAASTAGTASLADQVKACDTGNFFEVQSCRWHACSGHWGKDPACPSTAAAAQAQQQAQ
ncbi:MAG: phage tail protein [Paraburkholderia sp.]|nr:MAG: phage tail protein [Paraburkholderia sp.]